MTSRSPSGSPQSDGIFCGLGVILAILCSFPFAQNGVIDDWSYVKTAQIFAQTGHLVYNGWATAMLGWQIPWGALFIKLFGFSFTAPRISTLVSAFLCIWIFNRILNRFGINRRNNIFACLVLGLSPLFVQLAPTFMTDINGLLVILVCLYMCLRATTAQPDSASLGWLVAAALLNVVGGTARQIAWVGVLALVPSTAWVLRRRRHVLLAGALSWGLGVVAIASVNVWWARQPYAVSEHIVTPELLQNLHRVPRVGLQLLRISLFLALLLTPVLLGWLSTLRRLALRGRLAIAILLSAYATVLLLLRHRELLAIAVVPWVGDLIFTAETGEFNYWVIGSTPSVLPMTIRILLSLLVVVAVLSFLFALSPQRGVATSNLDTSESNVSWKTAIVLLGPVSVAYTLLFLPRAIQNLRYGMNDRYVLGLVPPVLILLFKLYQERVRTHIPTISYVALTAFSLYSILATHDMFAWERATVDAADRVQATGVPRTNLAAGPQFDGWTQINFARSVNDPRIKTPGFSFKDRKDLDLPKICDYPTAALTTVVNPEYFLTSRMLPCFSNSQFEPLTYSVWLPPFHRHIYIVQRR